jgi:hypothetical protein
MRKTTNPHFPPTLRCDAASNPLHQPEGEGDAKRPVRVLGRLALTLSALLMSQFLGCETTNYLPPITPQMATATAKEGQHFDLTKLNEGRTLFVHRCIECHTLPALWRYTTTDWSEIVNSMSHRASLKPAERDAVIAYILAVRREE